MPGYLRYKSVNVLTKCRTPDSGTQRSPRRRTNSFCMKAILFTFYFQKVTKLATILWRQYVNNSYKNSYKIVILCNVGYNVQIKLMLIYVIKFRSFVNYRKIFCEFLPWHRLISRGCVFRYPLGCCCWGRGGGRLLWSPMSKSAFTIQCFNWQCCLVVLPLTACNTQNCAGSCNEYGPGTCDGPCADGYGVNPNTHTCLRKSVEFSPFVL